MIDLATEHVLSLTEAAAFLPKTDSGRPVHRNSIVRWMDSGLGGINLEFLKIGQRRVTSKEACQRFAEALTRGGKAADGPSTVQRRHNSQAAGEELASAGF